MRRIPEVWRKRMEDSHEEQSESAPAPESLTSENVHHLRLGWTSRFDHSDIRNVVSQHPGISQWIPQTGEYLIGGPWRHRTDVTAVVELAGHHGAADLLRAFAQASGKQNKELALLSEHQESRTPILYERAGFELLEHILIYELPQVPHISLDDFGLHFSEMLVMRDEDRAALLELDHASFPWLWWNSEGEFLNYGRARGVKIYGGRDSGGNLVSYVGVTRFRSWGHLDRIAVHPDVQGQGIGLESLEWAIYVLAESGARRIGLSTQARNERSRYLYERYGFNRMPRQDYYLYGTWLGTNDDLDATSNHEQ